MVLKRQFVSDTEEASSLQIHWSGLGETEVCALSQYDSFSEKMVLKRPFVRGTEEPLLICSVLWEIELQAIFPGDREIQVDTIDLVAKSS